MIKNLILIFLVTLNINLFGQNLTANSIFGHNMVLQQGIAVPIWGTANPNEELVISFAGNKTVTKADGNGEWLAKLPKMNYSGPLQMVISTIKDTLILNDVMIGEVWLASGQSNMQLKMTEVNKSYQELKDANYDNIRFFTVEKNISKKPLENVGGSWKICTSENARNFSAVAYFFARNLHLDHDVPVGIISSSWGGTLAEAWTSRESLVNFPDFTKIILKNDNSGSDWENEYAEYLKNIQLAKNSGNDKKSPDLPKQRNYPSALYNSMIAPLVPYGIKGVIWYQGEGNAPRHKQYRSLFPLLINDWRNKWQNESLPFMFVQLPNYMKRNANPVSSDDWPYLREAQSMALKLQNTGMAVTIDVGEADDIHPKNKQDVGKRLFLIANDIVYKKSGTSSGPVFKSMKIKKENVKIYFTNIGKGLTGKHKALTAFEIAGADKKFYWADAKIAGKKIILSSKNVTNPVAVRYAWSNNPEASLFNKEGLPAAPFRTDDW